MTEDRNNFEMGEAMLPLTTVKFKTNPKNQYVAGGFILCTVSMSIGTVLGFSAILLPQLEEENLINSKSHQASWIASLINIGQIFGSVLMGILAGMLGRKITIILSCLILIASWTMIGLSNGSYTLLVLGRLLQGFGIMSSISQIYLVEISDIQRRGTIAGCGPFSVSSGITLVYTLGAVLPWRWVCLVCAGLPAATTIVMPFLPETPNWLVHNGKIQEAEKALRWLRGPDADIHSELKMLKSSQKQPEPKSSQVSQESTSKIEENLEKIPPKWLAQEEDDLLDFELKPKSDTNLSTSATTSQNPTGLKYTVSELMKPAAYKPFILLLATFILQQSTGTFAVIFYAVNVFKDIGASGNPYVAAILTGIIRQLGTLVGALLMSRCPRKTLMVVSAFLMALSMLSLGLTVHYSDYLTRAQTPYIAQLNSSNKVKRYSGDFKVDFNIVFSDSYLHVNNDLKMPSNSSDQNQFSVQNWKRSDLKTTSQDIFSDREQHIRFRRDIQAHHNESDQTQEKDVVHNL